MRHAFAYTLAGHNSSRFAIGLNRGLCHYHKRRCFSGGVGLMFINAVYFVDIPVMSAYLLLVGALFVIINLIVDLLYLAIDPRIRDRNLKWGI